MKKNIMIQKIAGVAVIKKGNRYLILKRSKKLDYPYKWSFVAQRVHFGENIIDALFHGVKDETKLNVRTYKFFKTYSIVKKVKGVKQHLSFIVFICESSGKAKLNWESLDYKWVSLKDLRKFDLTHIARMIVKDL